MNHVQPRTETIFAQKKVVFLWVAMGHGTGTKGGMSIEHGTKPNDRCSLQKPMVCTNPFMKWGKSGAQRSTQLGMLITRSKTNIFIGL